MTRLIWIVVIVAALWGVYGAYHYWETFLERQEAERKAEAAKIIVPRQLPGMPGELEESLAKAQAQGATAFGNWLSTHAAYLQDPRKGWIQLDYCVMIARESPPTARRIFADVKQRTPPTSPIWRRVQELQKSYE